MVENITSKKIKKLRCDNGKEYVNKDISRLAKEKEIILDLCPPYVHQLNRTAERYNRSIMDTARYLLSEARINKRYWLEIIKTTAYLKNRTLANTIEKKTSYEILIGKKPNIKNLRIYGSRVFVRFPEEKRKSKWDRKADLGILLGYENVRYRVLINNKVTIARHVDIVEENVNLIGLNNNDREYGNEDRERNNTVGTASCKLPSEKEMTDDENKNEGGKELEMDKIILRRSERERKKPDRYSETTTYSNYIYVNFVSADTPTTYEKAVNSKSSLDWKQAMDKEIKSLIKNKTSKLVDRPKDKKILYVKWIYTTRTDNRKTRSERISTRRESR